MAEALITVERAGVPGDVVECGVWRGGNIMLACLIAPSRACWLYDTFDGMTDPDAALDLHRDGGRAVDRMKSMQRRNTVGLDEVMFGFENEGIDVSKCHFVQGPAETSLLSVSPLRVAILRLDMDWHQPTKVALEVLYPRISPGGFLIVDDYGHWMGCKKAVDDYFGKNVPAFTDADYSCRVFRK